MLRMGGSFKMLVEFRIAEQSFEFKLLHSLESSVFTKEFNPMKPVKSIPNLTGMFHSLFRLL